MAQDGFSAVSTGLICFALKKVKTAMFTPTKNMVTYL